MADVEQRIINTQLSGKIEIVDAKFNQFMEEMKDFKNEMRIQNAANDAKISKIESKIDSMTSHIQILAVTAVGGIIAAGVGIAAMVITVLLNLPKG